MKITLNVNEQEYQVDVSPTEILAHVLRQKVGTKSLKCGCERGDCGSCTILLDGKSVKSCLVLAVEADKRKIKTLEGLMKNGKMTKLQEKFLSHNSFQCGYCAPGMTMSVTELLDNNPHPDEEEIKEAIAGNLCRCTGYSPIIDAIKDLTK